MVWTNCNKYEADELEKIPIEAVRIVIGSTKLVSISNLYEEKWMGDFKRKTKTTSTNIILQKIITHI